MLKVGRIKVERKMGVTLFPNFLFVPPASGEREEGREGTLLSVPAAPNPGVGTGHQINPGPRVASALRCCPGGQYTKVLGTASFPSSWDKWGIFPLSDCAMPGRRLQPWMPTWYYSKKKYLYMYLFERPNHKRRDRSLLPIDSLPKLPQLPWLGWAQARSRELHSGLLLGWHGFRHLDSLLPSQAH